MTPSEGWALTREPPSLGADLTYSERQRFQRIRLMTGDARPRMDCRHSNKHLPANFSKSVFGGSELEMQTVETAPLLFYCSGDSWFGGQRSTRNISQRKTPMLALRNAV